MQKEMSWRRWRRWQIDCRDQSQGVARPERPNAHNRKANRSRNAIAVVNWGAESGPSRVVQGKGWAAGAEINGKAHVARGWGRQGPRDIPDCDMEHRTWPERPGAVV